LVEADDATRARAHRSRSEVALELGRFARAETEARAALALVADDVDALLLLSRALLALGRLPDAERAARSAVERAPDDAYTRYIAGFVLQVAGKHREAQVELRAAVALNSQAKRYRARLAIALCELGEHDEARSIVDGLEPLGSEDPLLLDECARVYVHACAYEVATRCARRAVERRPADPAAHWRLAWALAQDKRFEECAGHATEALRIDPNFWCAWELLGMALYQLRADVEAESVLFETLRMKPAMRSASLWLAAIYLRNGRYARAARVCQTALAIHRDDPELSRLHATVRDHRESASRARLKAWYKGVLPMCALAVLAVRESPQRVFFLLLKLIAAMLVAIPVLFALVERLREDRDDAPPPRPDLTRRAGASTGDPT
jgi:tetratricopeptide (TPR) repeat protein